MRHLEINDRLYSLRPAEQGGDLIGGLDIGDLSLQLPVLLARLL